VRDIDVAYLANLLLSDAVRNHSRFLAILDRLGLTLVSR